MLAFVPHSSPLLEGRLVGRYDRFVADVELPAGPIVRTHCVNPGRMEGLVRPGARVWISEAPKDRRRKLRFTWELIEHEGCVVGANTSAPNTIVEALLRARTLRGFRRYRTMQRERRYGERSRVDFWLSVDRTVSATCEHYVEVKNCHLVYPDGRGYFPDSVSVRATRHLEELVDRVHEGHRATVLFTVQDERAEAVRPSDVHDPTFADAVRWARREGVRFRAVRVRPTLEGYAVEREVPVDTRPYRTERMRGWRTERDASSGWVRRPRPG